MSQQVTIKQRAQVVKIYAKYENFREVRRMWKFYVLCERILESLKVTSLSFKSALQSDSERNCKILLKISNNRIMVPCIFTNFLMIISKVLSRSSKLKNEL